MTPSRRLLKKQVTESLKNGQRPLYRELTKHVKVDKLVTIVGEIFKTEDACVAKKIREDVTELKEKLVLLTRYTRIGIDVFTEMHKKNIDSNLVAAVLFKSPDTGSFAVNWRAIELIRKNVETDQFHLDNAEKRLFSIILEDKAMDVLSEEVAEGMMLLLRSEQGKLLAGHLIGCDKKIKDCDEASRLVDQMIKTSWKTYHRDKARLNVCNTLMMADDLEVESLVRTLFRIYQEMNGSRKHPRPTEQA